MGALGQSARALGRFEISIWAFLHQLELRSYAIVDLGFRASESAWAARVQAQGPKS